MPSTSTSIATRSIDTDDAQALAVVLHDLAWLLPRTVGAEASRAQPLPPSELEIMRLLSRRPGRNVNEVAAELGIRSTNVSTAVRSLVARDLLRRETDASDGRMVRLFPTDHALADREAREHSWGGVAAETLAGMTQEHVDRLISAVPALRALAERLSGHES